MSPVPPSELLRPILSIGALVFLEDIYIFETCRSLFGPLPDEYPVYFESYLCREVFEVYGWWWKIVFLDITVRS